MNPTTINTTTTYSIVVSTTSRPADPSALYSDRIDAVVESGMNTGGMVETLLTVGLVDGRELVGKMVGDGDGTTVG